MRTVTLQRNEVLRRRRPLRRDVEEAQRAQRPSQCNAESRRICSGPIATERRVGERGERIDCGAQNTTEQEEHSDQRA